MVPDVVHCFESELSQHRSSKPIARAADVRLVGVMRPASNNSVMFGSAFTKARIMSNGETRLPARTD